MKSPKQNFPMKEGSESGGVSDVPAMDPRVDSDELIRSAHRVLVHYLPGAPLPLELFKVRSMLDAHMFGRDKRTQRDDVVRIARQIDRWRASRSEESTAATTRRRDTKGIGRSQAGLERSDPSPER